MGEKRWENIKEYNAFYNSRENMWRPALLKTDLPDSYISAIRIQAAIQGVKSGGSDNGTISAVISRYIKEGLSKDGRIKEAASNGI